MKLSAFYYIICAVKIVSYGEEYYGSSIIFINNVCNIVNTLYYMWNISCYIYKYNSYKINKKQSAQNLNKHKYFIVCMYISI